MKIEDKVVSLELAKRMKKLGWGYETERYWTMSGDFKTYGLVRRDNLIRGTRNYFNETGISWYPAPDAVEIGERLPDNSEFKKWDNKNWDNRWNYMLFHGNTEAEARGEMWCYLKGKELGR